MIKIAIADDHAVLRQALSEMLTAHGKYYVSGQFSSGEQLLEWLQHEEADLAIVDLMMPGIGGIETISAISRLPKPPPVLVLSAEEGVAGVRAALSAGAKGFVPKNSGIEELEFAIDAVMQGNNYLSPSITTALMSKEGADIDIKSPLSVLTERELEVFKLLADGQSNRDIAHRLHISVRTVDTHRTNILRKLNLRNNSELTKLAIASKVLSIGEDNKVRQQ